MPACWPELTTSLLALAVCLVLISLVTVFSPFLPLFSRGTKSEWGLLARPRAAFCGGAKKLRFSVCFLGGPQTRRVSLKATKQKPAVPPARRGNPHLAVPARRRGARKEK